MTDFILGLNDPSPVSRVLILGYYDGSIDGVLQLGHGGSVYRFDFADSSSGQSDEWQYLLRPLPSDAFDLLVAIIGEHIEPKWPAWLPPWRFPSEEVKADVERRVDAILEQAAEPTWRIITPDTVEFSTVIAEPVRTPARVV